MNLPDQKSHESLAVDANLTYTTDSLSGIHRIKHGNGFIFKDDNGNRVSDNETIVRIKKLAIPPAWSSVWICKNPKGHLQVTGIDEKGRKQYRYHEEWIAISQENKFNRMLFFSDVLPTIREKVAQDMRESALTKRKVLATLVWLLEHTYIRIGNEEYAKEYRHYGLTTLRTKHVLVEGNNIRFDFIGKSGRVNSVDIKSQKVARTIQKLEELPGYELFQYRENNEKHVVTSENVNEYLREITGASISAKDFRTWGGTVLSAITLNDLGVFTSTNQANKNITKAVRQVSQQLRNTPSVCRKHYIHPVIPHSYEQELLIPFFIDFRKAFIKKAGLLSMEEIAVVKLLKEFNQ